MSFRISRGVRTRPLWRAAILVFGLVTGGSASRAQEAVFRIDVELVRLLATVKDSSGSPVGDLAREDFRIFDNGVEQSVAVFEKHTSLPLSVALLIDTSGSTANRLSEETDSVLRFAGALLRDGHPDDALILYSFNHDVTMETGFTRRLKRIKKELEELEGEAGTSLYDALYFASRALGRREGRRVIVVVSDGANTTSVKSFQEALEAAHDADAVIYGVAVAPVTSDAGRHIAGENALISLAKGTGGRVLSAALGEALDAAFDSILLDLRTQYLLGYYPRNIPYTSERFHRLEVTVNRPDLRVLTRTGYYGEYSKLEAPEPTSGGPSRRSRQQE